MFETITLVMLLLTGGVVALTPLPDPELLTPEPMTARRLLASLVPGWVTRRQARAKHETMEDATTIAWVAKVRETDPDRLTIGVNRRGEPAVVQLPRSLPPWGMVTPPPMQSSSMIPESPEPLPVPMIPIVAQDPPEPEADPQPWWAQEEVPPEPPAEPRPWQYGDSGDPPTLVRGVRLILDEDLRPYLEEMPGYGEK